MNSSDAPAIQKERERLCGCSRFPVCICAVVPHGGIITLPNPFTASTQTYTPVYWPLLTADSCSLNCSLRSSVRGADFLGG